VMGTRGVSTAGIGDRPVLQARATPAALLEVAAPGRLVLRICCVATVEAYPAAPAARCAVRGIGARLARKQLPPTERRNMADQLNRFFRAIVKYK
jgi:hypothetical protein